MRLVLHIVLMAATCGLLCAQHHKDCPHHNSPEKKAEVVAMKKVFAEAKEFMVLEGLPHPYSEEKLLEAEAKRKDTMKLAPLEEPFYTPAAKATNDEDLRKALSGPDNISIYSDHKCGFHADYALRWQHKGITYHAAFCFGCADMAVTDGKTTQWFSFSTEVMKPLLAIYDKKRPKKQKTE